MKKQVSPKIVALVFGIIVICFAVAFYAFSWTGPTALPPGGNVDPPINVGGTGQYKLGSLGIGGAFHAYSNAIIDGNVGIGTPAPSTKLDINGSIRIRGGNPGAGKVLTSDINGLASWETSGGSGIPSGMIAMFTSACPSGWTRFAALDGLFPRGSSSYGATGNPTHTHTLIVPAGGSIVLSFAGFGHLLNISPSSSNSPYMNVIWCEKD